MKRNSIKQRAKLVPPEIKRMVNRSMATAREINRILENQGKTQKDLAVLLGKKESEISKWLRGTHNFTYKTISKIEIALGEPIILLPEEARKTIYLLAPVKADSEQTICINTKKEMGSTILDGTHMTFTESRLSTESAENPIDLYECVN